MHASWAAGQAGGGTRCWDVLSQPSTCDIGTASSGAQHHSCPKTLPCAPPAVQRSAPASPVTTGTDVVFNLRSSSEISKSEGPIRENHHFISSLKCSHGWNDRRQCLRGSARC